MIHSFWLFNRHCDCIYVRKWHQTQVPSKSLGRDELFASARAPAASQTTTDDTAKLIFGIVHSLRSMMRKISDEDSFVTYKTSKYRLHYYETASNLKFVILTDPKTESLRPALHQIYVQLYVEFVAKNPLSPVEHTASHPIDNELFVLGLDAFIASLPSY